MTSHPAFRRAAKVVGLFWIAVFLFVTVQSVLNLPVAGVRPEAVRLILMMTFPFTLGVSVCIIGAAFLMARLKPGGKQGSRGDPDLPA